MPNGQPGPLLVQLTRGKTVESEHLVDAVVANRNGTEQSWGDPDRVVFPRSAIKSVQALPLIMSGAADHFGLTDRHLAIACASHSGEPKHLKLVTDWLATIDRSPEWLECGPSRPLGEEARLNVGKAFTSLHNCCSGKHAGFLSIAQHLNIPSTGYLNFDHKVQQLVTEATEALTGLSLDTEGAGIDGCGIPTFPIPVSRLAQAMARLVDSRDLGQEWSDACERIVSAMKDLPWWVSGTGRHEVLIHELATEPVISKTGADGVFASALPGSGIGVACKARDGATRASDAAIVAVLSHLGVVPAEAMTQPITNTLSDVVGSITVKGLH